MDDEMTFACPNCRHVLHYRGDPRPTHPVHCTKDGKSEPLVRVKPGKWIRSSPYRNMVDQPYDVVDEG